MTEKRTIQGFTRISGPPNRVGWVRCDRCGRVIESSGLGIGSHRRAHQREDTRKRQADVDDRET